MADPVDPLLPDQNAQASAAPRPARRYQIAPSWYEARGYSFSVIARQRMCEASLARLGEPTEMRVPVEIPRTKRVRFETRTVRYGDDPIAVVQECCAKTPGYREPLLPLKEILFRLLLADGNRPKTAQELYSEVLEWIGYSDGRAITPETIERVLERDDYYGFAPAPDEGNP